MARVLIVGFGNPLRGDDGFGWHAALQLSRDEQGDEVQVLALHQLAPELADTVSHSGTVIFLDASETLAPGEIREQEVVASDLSTCLFTHHLDPTTLLACARTLYGANSRAVLITVGGAAFGLEEKLSPPVAAALPVVIERVGEIAREALAYGGIAGAAPSLNAG